MLEGPTRSRLTTRMMAYGSWHCKSMIRWWCALVMKTRTAWLGHVGGLLVAVAGSALANPFRWIGLGDRSWLWLFLAAAGLGIVCVTCLQLTVARRGLGRVLPALAVVGLFLAALVAAGFGLFRLAFQDPDQRVVATSSDGRFEIIVHDTSSIIDPVEGLYVETTSGPFSRRAYLGCLSARTSESIDSARFAGTGTVVLEGTKQWTLRFDPENVRAIDTVKEGGCARQLYTG
jgi:hypothetical protein